MKSQTLILLLSYLLAGIFLFSAGSADVAASEMKKAVIVFSYRQGWWAVKDENRGIIRGLASRGYREGRNIAITRLYMNTKTVNKTPQQMEAAAVHLLQQIKAIDPDVMFVMDDDALRHVGAKLLDTDLPIVFGGINLLVTDPDYGWITDTHRTSLADSLEKPGHNITGVLERIAIASGFNLLHQILPNARTALFLSDNSDLSQQMLRTAGDQKAFANLPLTIVEKLFTDDYEKMKRTILDHQDKVDCIVMFLPWTLVDSKGFHVPQEKMVRWILENNKRPGIAYLDILAEEGFLCGVVVDMVQQGVHAGIMAGRILNGEQARDIPILDPVANRITINLARAKQLGVEIPFEILKNADVVYKTMTLHPEMTQGARP
jgi:putative tryptophan/tyrosine transport system substrate-binding protein